MNILMHILRSIPKFWIQNIKVEKYMYIYALEYGFLK